MMANVEPFFINCFRIEKMNSTVFLSYVLSQYNQYDEHEIFP
jgi:hypothetical protein